VPVRQGAGRFHAGAGGLALIRIFDDFTNVLLQDMYPMPQAVRAGIWEQRGAACADVPFVVVCQGHIGNEGNVDKLIDKLPDIIREAAQSPLGIVALLVIAFSVLAFFFFRGATEKTRILIFSMLFLGVLGFGSALLENRQPDPPEPEPEPFPTPQPAPAPSPAPTPAPEPQPTPLPVSSGFPSGYGMQICGCWGPDPQEIVPEARCASGQVRLNQCSGWCPTGSVPYAYVCQ
jgi:hypothetical protein